MAVDLLSVLEAGYQPAVSDAEWTRGVLAAVAPALDQGMGCVGALYDLRKGPRERFGAPIATSADAQRFVEVAGRAEAEPGTEEFTTRLFLEGAQLGSASAKSRLGGAWATHPAIAKHHGPLGVRDVLGLVTQEPSGVGLAVLMPMRHVRAKPAHDVVLWSRIAAHLAAGLRLRSSRQVPPEAVATPEGRIVHAEGSARAKAERTSLGRAVRASERARGKLRRRSPEEAVAIWRGLVSGTWSLVDWIDQDGRRYVVARRNQPRSPAWTKLTEAEAQTVAFAALGHSNKLIAYELGVSISTVAMRLSRAAAKVGAPSRVALIRAYAARKRRGR
jgi:DNA-binding CsgD family transcriptional regulator